MITLCCQRKWWNEQSEKHERIIKLKLTKLIEQNEPISDDEIKLKWKPIEKMKEYETNETIDNKYFKRM